MIILKGYNPQTIDAYEDQGNIFVSLGFEDSTTAKLFFDDMQASELKGTVVLGGTHVILNVDQIKTIQT